MTCPNGHPAAPDSSFCSTCGAPVSPVAEPAPVMPQTPPPAPPQSAQGSANPKPWIWLGAGGLALVLLVAIVVGVTSGSDDDEPRNGASSSSDSNHDICVKQVLAIAGNLADNGAYADEMAVNGGEDPFLDAANKISGKYLGEQYQIGRKAAFENSVEAAEAACSGPLNDRIRENYPTDGSHG